MSAHDVLRLLTVPGVGPARVRRVLDVASSLGKPDLDTLIATESGPLRAVLSESQISALKGARKVDAEETERRLADANARLFGYTEDTYPRCLSERLGAKAPVLLSVMGNAELLCKPAVGFCGSRKASARGIDVAKDCAQQLASAGIVVVSGYAAGVDTAAHHAALQAGGATVVVLAEGILSFKVKADLRAAWDWDRVAVVSEFLPSTAWSVQQAMQRNRTICGLSNALVVIEAGETGGSIAAGKACLSIGLPCFAPAYEGMPETARGNEVLVGLGARRVLRNRLSGRANLQDLLAELESRPASQGRPIPTQMSMLTDQPK